MSKKFKDTKLGKFLKDKAPNILNIVGNVLPDKGVLGIVKNLVDSEPSLTPEEKQQIHKQVTELYELEVADRDSARKREVEIAKVKKFDFMFNLTGLVGLGTFVFLVYCIVYITIPESNEKTFYTLIGLCEGIVLSIFGFYFGSISKK
jgi:hypothetical protein|tara:strand:- start:10 stop:453 length:444 start_codon:yes stop_codon:yes gene_type:complete